jgi:hypothetical protein
MSTSPSRKELSLVMVILSSCSRGKSFSEQLTSRTLRPNSSLRRKP